MRARDPDCAGVVVRDDVTIGYEEYGRPSSDGRPTILLMPTWALVHARIWKLQVPYLARHFHVVVYDGPGNGRSDRSTDPARHSSQAVADDAIAVLDACGVERVVAVGLSMGAVFAVQLATRRPDIVAGLVLVGPAMAIAPPLPERSQIPDQFLDPAPVDPDGWDRYNLAYWHAQYDEFARWFCEQIFPEPHSTKQIEDAVSWSSETGPDVLEATATGPADDVPMEQALGAATCPTLVIHGSNDKVQSHAVGVEAARLSGGNLVTFEGSGHAPNLRDPVRFNLLVREFTERVGSCGR